jgi:hypothetical protein
MKRDYDELLLELKKYEKNGQIQLRFLPELQADVIDSTSFLNHRNPTNSERLYCIRNNITSVPKCHYCGNETKYNTKTISYNKYCSRKCADSCPEKRNKTIETNIKKYGVDNPMKVESIKNKSKENNNYAKMIQTHRKNIMEKYGVDHVMKIESVKKKLKQTNIKKYGVDNPMKVESIKNKVSKTLSKNNFNKSIMNERILKYVEPLFSEDEYNGYNNKKMYNYRCKVCNQIFSDWIDASYKRIPRCPNCFPKKKSRPELELLLYIKSVTNSKVIENDRNILGNQYELDIYIPDKNIAIEFNGLFWHSELNGKDKNYHLNKLNKCRELGITLIQIFEDEWLYKTNIVKSRLSHLLSENNKKVIYARNCYVEEISNDFKREFLNRNHIQGSDNSVIKLGLWYPTDDGDELVSVMTFCKPRKSLGHNSNKYDYELSRFANDLDYRVVGSFSKLFKYFERNYEWNSVITYADLRWSKGNVYLKNGFQYSHTSEPNYWYFKRNSNDGKRFHRYGFRKQILKEKFPEIYNDNKTEIEMMRELKYERVWDCGNLVFIYERK